MLILCVLCWNLIKIILCCLHRGFQSTKFYSWILVKFRMSEWWNLTFFWQLGHLYLYHEVISIFYIGIVIFLLRTCSKLIFSSNQERILTVSNPRIFHLKNVYVDWMNIFNWFVWDIIFGKIISFITRSRHESRIFTDLFYICPLNYFKINKLIITK